MGLSVWCTDQAGPFQTIPQQGASWQPLGKAACQSHQYFRQGTAKILTLFHPADGQVRVEGTLSCTNAVLHGWLKRELTAILETLPASVLAPEATPERSSWERWQAGLTVKPTLAQTLPPLRMLLVLDNLVGHTTPEFVLWLFAHGILPLSPPLGAVGSTWQRAFSAFSSNGHWRDNIPPRRTRSLLGLKPSQRMGTGTPLRLSGAENAKSDASGNENGGIG
jgi:hypothetical protein